MKKISTSELAKRRGILGKDLFERLCSEKLIKKIDGCWELTKKGKAEYSGEYKTHPMHGTYIVWPEDMPIPEKEKSQTITATTIGKKFEISSNRINHILSELGWIKKDLKGWQITSSGKKAGGIQKEDQKSGIPYAIWDDKILNNNAFKNSISEAQGAESQEKPEQNKTNNFREKFEAKHRTTDGHFVRSKSEMLIDNFLYTAGIVHAYERMLPIEEVVYCDFYLPSGNVYIEFWGLEEDPKYLERKKKN